MNEWDRSYFESWEMERSSGNVGSVLLMQEGGGGRVIIVALWVVFMSR